jgi:hypothetical protein
MNRQRHISQNKINRGKNPGIYRMQIAPHIYKLHVHMDKGYN